MMSVNNDPPRPTTTSEPNDIHTLFLNMRPEDKKSLRECLSSSYFKGGLPLAMFIESAYFFKILEKPKPLTKRGLLFMTNFLVGTFAYMPTCYRKFMLAQKEFIEQQRIKERPNIFPVTEDTQPVRRVDDFSYPADVMTNLSEPETNFSSDFNSSTIISDVSVEKDLKTPGTTYEDLRAQNRKNFAYEPPVSSFTSGYSSAPSSNTPPVNKTPTDPSPPRRVVRNKYGDEIE